ncbi:hypothetical protein IRJ41_021085 [Triplophysa rosa]|uniref:Uncharacterized protein n=1 Tax=Triplophysa rosa TaxID=992332 RepID=A0A9W7WHM3_TRIRA|nr:hypothetical protein IRJ41_021085 [Triplophysa rosa]
MDDNQCVSKHKTIQEGRSFPQLKKCTTCCQDFHCPFCSFSLFHPTKLSKVKSHLESHLKRAHCIHCDSMVLRKPDFMKHLSFCKGKHPATITSIPAPTISNSSSVVFCFQRPTRKLSSSFHKYFVNVRSHFKMCVR